MINNDNPPLDYPGHIPCSMQDASAAYERMASFQGDITRMNNGVFMAGWFAIHFAGVAPHPDDLEAWPPGLKRYGREARRRYEGGDMGEDAYYCVSAQQEGIRLLRDGTLRCHVVATSGGSSGYVAGAPQQGEVNRSLLTCEPAKARLFDSPKSAVNACSRFCSYKVYPGEPQWELNGTDMKSGNGQEKEVVIRSDHGLYLYRDGETFGPDPVRACKYLLHGDRVEKQLRQVKRETGYNWTWIDYEALQHQAMNREVAHG